MNGISDVEGIKKFGKDLKNCKKTNMEEFINFCLELIEKQLYKRLNLLIKGSIFYYRNL